MSSKKDRPFVVLDLDQTLISSESIRDFDEDEFPEKSGLFDKYVMDDYYIIYARPHLQEFLDYLFHNFNVTVWTAASKDYALYILEHIVLQNRPERCLDFFFFSYHCGLSKKFKKGSKNLKMLWDVHRLPGYTDKNTVILDDYVEDVHRIQPNKCIIAPPFEFLDKGSENDHFLKDLIPHLDIMKEQYKTGKPVSTSVINAQLRTLKRKK